MGLQNGRHSTSFSQTTTPTFPVSVSVSHRSSSQNVDASRNTYKDTNETVFDKTALLSGVFDEEESHNAFLAARGAFLRTMDDVANLDANKPAKNVVEKGGEEEERAPESMVNEKNRIRKTKETRTNESKIVDESSSTEVNMKVNANAKTDKKAGARSEPDTNRNVSKADASPQTDLKHSFETTRLVPAIAFFN